MSLFWKDAGTVASPTGRRVPLLRCLAAFGLTALVVFRWGYESRTPTRPSPAHTATAYVMERSAGAATALRIPICFHDDNPNRAREAANALAERYVQNRRADWRRRTEGPCLIARQTAEQARRELAASESRLDALRRQMAEEAAKPRAVAQPIDAPSMVDNPAWLDLNRQFARLQQRYDTLLVDRTPLHPAVAYVGGQIDDLKNEIAKIPQKLPAETPVPALNQRTTAEPAPSDADTAKQQARCAELTAAVESARRACEQADLAEKQALRQQQAGPQYVVEPAQVVANKPPQDASWARLIGTALMAGALMAFGLGALSVGARIEPPVANGIEVEQAAGAGVVAMIPSEKKKAADPAKIHRQWRVRWALRAIGLAFIAACPVVAVWGIAGL